MNIDLDAFVSIDAAVDIGWFAFWASTQLVGARTYDPWGEMPSQLGPFRSCLVEVPRIRPKETRQGKADPNDIVRLGVSAGRLTRPFDLVQQIAPEAWKGQLPKDVAFRRSLKALTQPEIKLLGDFFHMLTPRSSARAFQDPTEKQLNMWDAVGEGLWRLGRTGPG